MFTSLRRDLFHAARSLAKARAFTFVCVVSLGIGMVPVIAIPYWARVLRMPPAGVNTAGLVQLVTTPHGSDEAGERWSYPDFETLRESDTGISLIGWTSGESQIAIETSAGARTESVATMFVSTNYFKTIGLALARGAGFDATGDNPLTAEPVVILGYTYWQNQLGSYPEIIGKTLTLDGIPHVVVGVAPEHFSGHMGYQERQLFLPLGRYAPLRADTKVRFDRGNEWLNIHGRLSPGVGVGQASATVAAVTSRLATEYPATNQLKAGSVVPYDPLGYRNEFRIVETLFFTLTGAVLVVVCLNISGMMLVRSAMRERELSIRHAIGASRGRLVRYLLSEAVVLAGLAAVLGSVVLFNAPRLLAWWTGRPLPFEVQQALRFDPFIVAICVGLCLATSVVFGLLPATRFSRPVIISSLKDDAGVGGLQAGRVHRFTAALQVAIAVPLIVLSAIALDLVRVTATGDLGFESDSLYAAPLTFRGVADERVTLRIRSLRDTLDAASGVASVTVADGLPLDFRPRGARVSLQVDKNSAPRAVFAHTTRVGDGYLDTMGIPLLVGRGFTNDDSAGAEMVTVISKTLADQLEPDSPGTVVGRWLTIETDGETQQTLIVGVTRDFPTEQMSSQRAQLLLPLAQHPSSRVFLIARSELGEPLDSARGRQMKVTTAIENAVRDLGPEVDRTLTDGGGAVYSRIVTGVWLRENSVRDFLLRSAITGSAGTVILTLAALGIYGLVGLMVTTRTREIAVRAALGASRRGVMGMILFDVVKLAMPGVIVGLLIAAAIVRLNGDNLGVKLIGAEPLAYVVGAAIALLVAVLASLLPARRAASVQPMVAMRST
jgi:ABC-type antimicrobial peptide transport system, permease component